MVGDNNGERAQLLPRKDCWEVPYVKENSLQIT